MSFQFDMICDFEGLC